MTSTTILVGNQFHPPARPPLSLIGSERITGSQSPPTLSPCLNQSEKETCGKILIVLGYRAFECILLFSNCQVIVLEKIADFANVVIFYSSTTPEWSDVLKLLEQ